MIVFGAGGHAKVVIDCLEASGQPIESIIDNDVSKISVLGYPVTHAYDPDVHSNSKLVIAIGNNKTRKEIAHTIRHQAGAVIHPHATVSSHSSVGTGTVIFNRAVVQTSAAIGRHVIINSSAVVEHDCIVGSFAHIAPNATLCGEVSVGEGTLIGAGAVVLPGVSIGKWATIGAGCTVKRDVPDFATIKPRETSHKKFIGYSQKDQIFLSPPHLGSNESAYINEVLASNWIAPKGEALNKFEENICKTTGAKAAIALSSGTAALHLALIVLGVGAGDEVICPTFTFAATANPVLYQKAIPIFIDCEPDAWNMQLETLEEAIKDRIHHGKKPKAIMAVHNYGMPGNMDKLSAIAHKYEIPVIEDAAEAVGSTFRGQPVGTFGTLGTYSFNGNKIITTGGGGALVSDKPELVKKAKFLATQAHDDLPYYHHTAVGYNYRMSNVLAAIGNAQIELLEQHLEKRRNIFEYYQNKLSGISSIGFQQEGPDCYSNRWLSCITMDSEKASETIENIRKALKEKHIETRYLWKPLHTQPIFKNYPFYGNGIAEKLFTSGLCLPSGSALTRGQQDRIIKVIKKWC